MNNPGTQRGKRSDPAAGRPHKVVHLNERKLALARRLCRTGMDDYSEKLGRLRTMVTELESELGSCQAMLSGPIEACRISLDIHATCNDALKRGDLDVVIRLRDTLLNAGLGRAVADRA